MRFDLGAIESYILGGIIYSSLSAYILFFFNKKDVKANRLLALGLLGVTWYCFIFLMTRLGWIIKFTWLYGYGTPLYYTIPVFFYWYVHRYTNPELRSHRRNFWHFLPSLISFIAMIPFYLSPASVKLGVKNELIGDLGKIMTVRVGWIPLYWHLIIRPLQAGIYLWFQWTLLSRVTKDKKDGDVLSGPLRKWLLCFTLLETLIYSSLAITTIIGFRYVDLGWGLLTMVRWPYGIGILLYLLMGVFLFVHPEMLYGNVRSSGAQRLSPVPAPVPVPALMPVPGSANVPEPMLVPEPATVLTANPEHMENPAGQDTSLPEVLKVPEVEIWEIPEAQEIPEVRNMPEMPDVADDEELSRIALLLKEHINTNQLYKRPKLTLHLLASELALSPRMVSSVLNKYYKQRFTEYINTCRIEYVISRLEDPGWQELTLEGLAREAGFSSKSTFFAAFKKVTSVSPGEYLQFTDHPMKVKP